MWKHDCGRSAVPQQRAFKWQDQSSGSNQSGSMPGSFIFGVRKDGILKLSLSLRQAKAEYIFTLFVNFA